MWIAGRGIKDRKGELAAAAADPKRLVTPTPNGRALCWVLSEPKGALVFVGEQRLGQTPVELDVAGMRVRLELEGRKPFQGESRCGELVFLAARFPVVAPPPVAPPRP